MSIFHPFVYPAYRPPKAEPDEEDKESQDLNAEGAEGGVMPVGGESSPDFRERVMGAAMWAGEQVNDTVQ